MAAKKIIAQRQVNRICKMLDLENTRVKDIMIPRSNINLIKITQSVEAIKGLVKDSGHSRFPVIDEENKKVLGILFAKDLVIYDKKSSINQLIRKALFIPESKRLDNLLSEFQSKHQHMAIVIDEYGDHSGLVTIEDIIEQITGDIEDEHDIPDLQKSIQKKSHNEYLIQSITPIDEFNTYFKTKFTSDDIDTIGGIALKELGYIPKSGEKITIDNFEFTVQSANEKQINWLTVRKIRKKKCTEHKKNKNVEKE